MNDKTLILVQSLDDGRYHWHSSDGRNIRGEGALAELCEQVAELPAVELWLLLDGKPLRLESLPYNAKERRHLRQAAPFALEESLIGSVDQQHFAFSAPGDNEIAVACCDAEWLAEQIGLFEEAGLDLHGMVPAPLALRRESGWVLCHAGDELWVRTGHQAGFAVTASLAPLALQRLLAEQGEPASISLSASTDDDVVQLREWLPAGLQGNVQQCVEALHSRLQLESDALNLRQGAFSRQLPMARWWGQWRRLAAVAAVALGVFVVTQLVHFQQLKSEELAMRQQLEQVYRQVVPQGALVDARKQLAAKVRALQGSAGNGASPLRLLSQVAPVAASHPELELRGVNFTGFNGELRLSCWAPSFEVLQQLRNDLTAKGLQVDRLQASADGEGMQARIKVRAGGRV